jgi:hypothetical protein
MFPKINIHGKFAKELPSFVLAREELPKLDSSFAAMFRK